VNGGLSHHCGTGVADIKLTGIVRPSLRQGAAGTMHFEPGGVSLRDLAAQPPAVRHQPLPVALPVNSAPALHWLGSARSRSIKASIFRCSNCGDAALYEHRQH